MNQKHFVLACIIIACLLSSNQAQQCSTNQFSVKNNGEDYLTINSPTEVKTCGGINICNEINKAKQSLTLGNNSELSISNGNTVQLPSQTLSLSSSGEVSLSSGNSIELPDASSTNELQNLSVTSDGKISISQGNTVNLPRQVNDMISLSINKTTDFPNNAPMTLDFVEGSSIAFVAPYTIQFVETGTYHVSMAPAGVAKNGWFCVHIKCVQINQNILSTCNAVATDTGVSSAASRIVQINAGETCVWWVMIGQLMVPDFNRADWIGINILRLK